MHATLTSLRSQLTKLIAQVQSAIPNDEPFGNAHGNWTFPGLTKSELIEQAQSLVDLIDERGSDDIPSGDARLKDYVRRLEHLRSHTVPQMWGSSAQAAPAYVLTLDALKRALEPALVLDTHAENASAIRKVTGQVRSMEARLKGLEPRTTALTTMVERIEQAYSAADQLPTDLEALAEAQVKVQGALEQMTKDHLQVLGIRERAVVLDERLKKSAEDATAVIARCESAYSAATSVGLAAAFTERSRALSSSMWIWVVGLVVALVMGAVLGTKQLHSLSESLATPGISTPAIVLSLLLSVLSVAAPVWFGWLATKQIGQRFRLAEDYAFKASVSRAYEGYRREAARIDKDMEARLLSSALTRLDELPLRLVEPDSHGSPWHELASSDLVKRALGGVPGFAQSVKDLASSALTSLSSTKAKAP